MNDIISSKMLVSFKGGDFIFTVYKSHIYSVAELFSN